MTIVLLADAAAWQLLLADVGAATASVAAAPQAVIVLRDQTA